MTTDSGLVYLSGLLRAGAEPLSTAARAARRGAAGHAGEGDSPAGADAEGTEGAVAVKSLPGDAVEGVERHAQAQIQSRDVPPSSMSARAASVMNGESHTPAASPTTTVDGEPRTRPPDDRHRHGLHADEIRGGETERTPGVTEQSPVAAGEGELIPAFRSPLVLGRPPSTPHGEPNDSAVTHSENVPAVEGPARRASKAKTADDVLKNADEESAAPGASFLLLDASSARGSSARRDPSARASQASREEGSPTFAGGRARASEGGAGPADASAEPAADSAPFTLEAHVAHLRALMQTARAETPVEDEGTGAVRPHTTVASNRTPPLTTAARPAREQPRTAPRTALRTASEARPETPTPAANSVERQPVVLLNQGPTGASSGRVTSATEARPATPRAAWSQPGSVSPARARGEELTPAQSAPALTAVAPSVAQAPAPTVAPTSARVGPAPTREGGSTGSTAAGGGRAPKLIINRLDVQVVDRREPPPAPPPQPATHATESPPSADPWGALDRQLLGRFSY